MLAIITAGVSRDGRLWPHYKVGNSVPSHCVRVVGHPGTGNVFVAEGENHRIQKFDNNGKFITKWGSSGTEDGQFSFPYGVAVESQGNVFVADNGNSRIQFFAPGPVITTTTTTVPLKTTTTIPSAKEPGINYSNTTFQVNDAEGFNVTMRNVEVISQNPLTGAFASQSFDVGLEIRPVAGAGPFGVALVLTDIKPAFPGRPSSTKGTTLDFTKVVIASQGPEGTNIVLENLGVAIMNPITRRSDFKSFRVGLQLGPLFNAPPFNFGFVITSLE